MSEIKLWTIPSILVFLLIVRKRMVDRGRQDLVYRKIVVVKISSNETITLVKGPKISILKREKYLQIYIGIIEIVSGHVETKYKEHKSTIIDIFFLKI